jgi:hypothetical protein
MHCIALRRAVLASVCLGLLATRSDAREDSNPEIEQWVPAAALSFDILGQRSAGAVESDNFTGPPISTGGCETRPGVFNGRECLEPVPSTLALTPNVRDTDTTTAALVTLSLELMTPRLARVLASPRLFAHADGSLAFAFRRKLAGAGKPDALGLPPPPATGVGLAAVLTEETITGQGNRAFSELQTGVFTAGAGVAFTVKPYGRTLRIKPSFAYLRQEIEFSGLANRAIQIRGSNIFRPDGLEDYRLLSFSAQETRIQHGIGGGLELEVDTQSVGPFLLSVFAGARAYRMLGDIDVTLCSDQNLIGPSFSPDACETGTGEKVTWRFEPESVAWSGGVGLRFRFVP